MERILELIASVKHKDDFYDDFDYNICIDPDIRAQYEIYNNALMTLDNQSWGILKDKAIRHYLDERNGRKVGFFHHLNEAFAYQYLLKENYENVRLLDEVKGRKNPDILYYLNGKEYACEVKSFDISDDEIVRRRKIQACESSYHFLSNGFLNKFNDAVFHAKKQIHAIGLEGLIYVMIKPNDFTLEYFDIYKDQLITFSHNENLKNIIVRIGLVENWMIPIFD